MWKIRGSLCLSVLLLIVLSGCQGENLTAEKIADIEPMTKTEFDLAYTDDKIDVLLDIFREYTTDDYCVDYKIERNHKKLNGTYFAIGNNTYVVQDGIYYIQDGNGFYEISDKTVSDSKASGAEFDVPLVIYDMLSNITKADLITQEGGLEIYNSGNSVEETLTDGGISGEKSQFYIQYLKSYIDIRCTETDNYTDYTKIQLSFSIPSAIQHQAVEVGEVS